MIFMPEVPCSRVKRFDTTTFDTLGWNPTHALSAARSSVSCWTILKHVGSSPRSVARCTPRRQILTSVVRAGWGPGSRVSTTRHCSPYPEETHTAAKTTCAQVKLNSTWLDSMKDTGSTLAESWVFCLVLARESVSRTPLNLENMVEFQI